MWERKNIKFELMNSMFNCSIIRKWSYEAFWFIFNHSASKHWTTNVFTKVLLKLQVDKIFKYSHHFFKKNCIKNKIYKLIAK